MINPLNEMRLFLIRSCLKIRFGKRIELGKDFRCRKRFYCLIRKGTVQIGDHVSFNNDCSITALNKVIIGSDTLFGEGVKIYDHNHRFRKQNGLIRLQDIKKGEVIIGRNCWICSNVVILPGANIGDGCVIGTGCVINGVIPSNTLVKGTQNLTFEEIG